MPAWRLRAMLTACLVAGTAANGLAQTSRGVFGSSTPVSIPDGGAAGTYPSNIVVSGMTGDIYHVSVRLELANVVLQDLDIVLQAPNGRALMLMSDASLGQGTKTVRFDDCAPRGLRAGLIPAVGRYRPTNVQGGDADAMPSPAPAGPYGNTLSEFNGASPNGTWQIYLADDDTGTPNTSAFLNAWELTIFTRVGVVVADHVGLNPLSCSQPDFDGDGRTDVAVYRPETGQWFISQSGSGGAGVVAQFGAGTSSGLDDIAVPADYDGDGITDLAVYRRTTGAWWWVQSSNNFIGNLTFGAASHFNLGDTPVPGDYDGDGIADLAIFRRTTGQWFVNGSSGSGLSVTWGYPPSGDYPAR